MCAEESVKLEMHFRRKLGSGLFGGEGFILQKLTGPGTAFVEIAGEVQMVELQAGERLKVDPGHIAMYEPTCSYDIEMVKGVMNMFMGGEGLFLATITGPGRVWFADDALEQPRRRAQALHLHVVVRRSGTRYCRGVKNGRLDAD